MDPSCGVEMKESFDDTVVATPSYSAINTPAGSDSSKTVGTFAAVVPGDASSVATSNGPATTTASQAGVWQELKENPRLMLIILFVTIGGLLFGYDIGIIGGVTSLSDFRSTFGIDQQVDGADTSSAADTVSWVVSSFLLGAAAAALVTGPIADVISRRSTIFWGSVIFTIGGVLQGSAYSLGQMIVGRVVAGLAIGCLSTIVPVYNAEMASPTIRGICNTLFQLAITAGILLAFLLNLGFKHLHPYGWRLSLGFQSIFSVVMVTGMLFLPESPRFLMKKRREAEALAVLTKIRKTKPVDVTQAELAIAEAAMGSGDQPVADASSPSAQKARSVQFATFNKPVPRTAENATDWNVVKIPANTIEQEIEEMRASIIHQEKIGEASWADIFRTPLRVRVALGCGVQGWQQLTGMNAIMYYSSTIFANVGVDPLLTTAITGIVNFVATILTLPLIDKIGRVPLLLFGAIGMALCSLIVGIVGLYGTDGTNGIVIVVFVCLFVVNFAYSWGPCGWIVPSEIYPLSVRGKGVSLTTCVNWLGNFAISQATPHILSSAGVGPTFLLFFGLLAIIVVFVFSMVPETKGVSLEKMDRTFAVQTLRQYRQYVFNNFHHCLHILTLGLIRDFNNDEIEKQREANYRENKEREQRSKADQFAAKQAGAEFSVISPRPDHSLSP